MDTTGPNILGSDWTGLNDVLIAQFFPLKRHGHMYIRDRDEPIVSAPLEEGTEIEYQLDWHSPFENANADSKAPAFAAMLQSGILPQSWQSIANGTAKESELGANALAKNLGLAEGRTGITKLNSTQVFSGMPPIKIPMKILFRAKKDTQKEVMQPIKQLLKWAVPQELAINGPLVNLITGISGSKNSGIEAMLPSIAPRLLGFEYKNRLYQPMVIEQITDPITSPTASNGDYVRAEVNITLCSLTAWGRSDIDNIYGGY